MQEQKNNEAVIFVVDDEPMLLDLAASILQPKGYEIRTFQDPSAALRAYSAGEGTPDLVITDYAMHNLTGMDLIRECRRIKPSQKILLVSGTVDEDIYKNASAKPDRFLAKPYFSQQLVDAVDKLLAV